MKQQKEQKIIVLTTLSDDDKKLIFNGIKIASIFKKELCLVYNYPRKKKKNHELFRSVLQNYVTTANKESRGLKLSVLLTSEPVSDLPQLLADDYEAIILVALSSAFKTFSRAATKTPVPFLFVNTDGEISGFNKTVLPVDLRKETSDSALWTTYFGRFNQAETVVVAAREKNKTNEREVAKNVVLTKKLLQKFNINHKIYKGQRSSWRNAFEALDFAHSSGSNLFVVLGSSAITPLDLLIGLPERKLIKMAGEIPVLYVNPRRDNYVLCD